jgi:hypothetical protein
MTTRDTFSGQNTGDNGLSSIRETVPFDRYEIVLELGPHREFLRIVEVRVSKDFRSVQQKVESGDYHDVSDLYEDR